MRNLFWFAIAVALLAAAFVVHSQYMAYSLYAFLLLVAVANVSSRLWLTGLEVERRLSATMVRQGDDVTVDVTVVNRRGWPIPWIFIEDITPQGFPVSGDTARLAVLMPGRSVSLSYTLRCPRRGYHRVGPLVLESGDLFGLQRRFRTGRRQDYLSVLPTVAYIRTFTISARRPQGPVRISNRVYVDPTRISGLREYRPGDPLNRIHWKATARTGDLYVKEYQPSAVLGGTLILDLFADNYAPEKKEARMELAITTTASIAYLLQMSGEQVGMLTNGLDAAEIARYDVESRDVLAREDVAGSVRGEGESARMRPLAVPTRRSPVQAVQIAENLARVLPGHALDPGRLILEEFRRLPRDAALLPVLPQVSPDLALVLAEMKLSGFTVTVFLIDNNSGYAEAVALLAPHGIDVLHIEHERDLHELSPARIGR